MRTLERLLQRPTSLAASTSAASGLGPIQREPQASEELVRAEIALMGSRLNGVPDFSASVREIVGQRAVVIDMSTNTGTIAVTALVCIDAPNSDLDALRKRIASGDLGRLKGWLIRLMTMPKRNSADDVYRHVYTHHVHRLD